MPRARTITTLSKRRELRSVPLWQICIAPRVVMKDHEGYARVRKSIHLTEGVNVTLHLSDGDRVVPYMITPREKKVVDGHIEWTCDFVPFVPVALPDDRL